VNVVGVFTDELRAVTGTLRTMMQRLDAFEGDLQGCEASFGQASRDLLLGIIRQNRTLTAVSTMEGEEVVDWSTMLTILLLASIMSQLMLLCNHLGVPRTAVSQFPEF
jgi:hypothetical protein